jgi:hypothetical protein
MKNITITLQETVAKWARVEAAKAGMSLSRWIGHRLEDDMHGRNSREPRPVRDLEDFLSGPGWPSVGPMPKREEIYDRPALLRHKHSDLRDRPKRTRKAVRRR